jgi:hypothetical protein
LRKVVNDGETVLWQRLDVPGHEIATVARRSDGWLIDGVAVFVEAGNPCRIEYEIRCDVQWATRQCLLRGSIGARHVQLEIERGVAGEWSIESMENAALRGCDDVDLEFSPVTNLLPIRRLRLPIGAHARVRAAWVRFPELAVEVSVQTYARVASDRYQYESAGGAFRRELVVDAFGCAVEYPGLWRAEATATHGEPVA